MNNLSFQGKADPGPNPLQSGWNPEEASVEMLTHPIIGLVHSQWVEPHEQVRIENLQSGSASPLSVDQAVGLLKLMKARA